MFCLDVYSQMLFSDIGLVTIRTLFIAHVLDMLVHMPDVLSTKVCRESAADPATTADEIVGVLAADVILEMLL